MSVYLKYNLDIDERSRWNYNTSLLETRQNLIFLQEVGDFYAGPDYYTTREGFDSYLLKLTLSGCGLLRYGGRQYRVPPAHFYWIDCRERQDYRTDPETGDWHVLWVHFFGATAGYYYSSFLKLTGGEPVGTLTPDSTIRQSIEKLLQLNLDAATQTEIDMQASAILTDLLTQCILSAGTPRQIQSIPEPILGVRRYLNETYMQKITLADLGSRFALNPHYLQKLFKRYTGQSPTEYLIYLRMARAKEMMRTTQKSISEISYEVGIDNACFFSRQFKQIEGLTPQEYRSLWPRK